MVHLEKREEKGHFACPPNIYAFEANGSAMSAAAVFDANEFRQKLTIRNPAPGFSAGRDNPKQPDQPALRPTDLSVLSIARSHS